MSETGPRGDEAAVNDLLRGMRLAKAWTAPVAAWFLAALFLLPFVSPVLSTPRWDEFIVAFDAQRLLNGQVPYRDFFNFIPPGAFYVLAGLLGPLGGVSLTGARYVSLLLVLVNWALLHAALERGGWPRRQALGLSLLYPVALFPFWPVFSHHWLVHLFCFSFLLLSVWAPGRWSATRCAALGFSAGLAGMVLQTEGAYLVLWGLSLIFLPFQGDQRARRLGAFCAGTAAACFIWLGPLIALGAGGGFLRDVVLWPARNYSRPGGDNARLLLEDVPDRLAALWSGALLPSEGAGHLLVLVSGTLLYAGLLAAAAAVAILPLATLYGAVRRRGGVPPARLAGALVTALALGLFFRGRPDWLRLLYLLGFLGPLWLVAWRTGAADGGKKRAARLSAAAWILLAFAAAFHARWAWVHWPAGWELGDADRLTRESPVNRFLANPTNLRPGEAVAAFPEGGEIYLYGAAPALGYTFFTPLAEGYNDEQDHARAAREIQSSRARWVVMTQDLERGYLSPLSPVGRLLAGSYTRKGVLGHAVFYERTAPPEQPDKPAP
jgi:hypothetical protein